LYIETLYREILEAGFDGDEVKIIQITAVFGKEIIVTTV
jgi:hypothetical protein